jgi:hypothetical protein
MVGLAVELGKVGVDVGAELPHEALATGEHRVGEHGSAVCGDEHRVRVQRVDGAAAPPHVQLGLPAWHGADGIDRFRRFGVGAGSCRCR